MNTRTRIATIAAASILATSMGAAAFAEDGSVSQEVEEGQFTASLAEDSSMDKIAFRNTDATSTGHLFVLVDDARGTDVGWTVTLQSMSGFVGTNDEGTIPADGFSIIGYKDPVASVGQPDGVSHGTETGVLTEPKIVMKAEKGAGTGTYQQEIDVSLKVPSQTALGTYTATVTVGTSAAPGGEE